MNKYKMKWKRRGPFWRTEKNLTGHNFNAEYDRMDLYYCTGAIKTIAKWSECSMFLDTDWVLFTKKEMERQSGQDIKLNVSPEKGA